jgi:preprotein translocase subunit SecA
MEKLGMEEDEPIEHSMISKAIENAQRKVEGHNFDIRKHLLEYDDVMNKQREVIYSQRREVLQGENIKPIVEDMIVDLVEEVTGEFSVEKTPSEDWEWESFYERVEEIFNIKLAWNKTERTDLDYDALYKKLLAEVERKYQRQEEMNGIEQMRHLERMVLLQMVDTIWKEHLLNMDHLKEGIGLRGYGQKNPLDEYKKEGFNLFMTMIETVKQQTVGTLLRVQLMQKDELQRLEEERRQERERELEMAKRASGDGEESSRKPIKRSQEKVGRNAPCPCGSGKKYKKCCGKIS